MDEIKVSIVIPVYNVEKYLRRCIESVRNQTYRNLEIILVDDGSTDRSGMICDQACERDPRILVIHRENGGLSSARNTGIEAATGEYLTFADSDDYLSMNFVEKTVGMCERYQADIAVMKMLYIAENTDKEIKEKGNVKVNILSPKQAIEESLLQKRFSCCAPGKLYKHTVLHGIRFPERKLSEDLATCHLFMDQAERIVYTDEIGYYYRQHGKSIMHTFDFRRMDALEWAHQIEVFCKAKYPDILQAAYCRTMNVAVHLLFELPETGTEHDKYFLILWSEIKRTRKHVIICSKVRFREKAAAICSFAGEKFLINVWNSRAAVKKTER